MELRKADANQSRLPINPDVNVTEEFKQPYCGRFFVVTVLLHLLHLFITFCSQHSRTREPITNL